VVLHWLEIAVPQIDVDAARTIRRGSPQLGGREAHAVQRLGTRPATVSVGVGQRVDAMEAVDDTLFAARIAGQSRVAFGVDVACSDAVTRLEARLAEIGPWWLLHMAAVAQQAFCLWRIVASLNRCR